MVVADSETDAPNTWSNQPTPWFTLTTRPQASVEDEVKGGLAVDCTEPKSSTCHLALSFRKTILCSFRDLFTKHPSSLTPTKQSTLHHYFVSSDSLASTRTFPLLCCPGQSWASSNLHQSF